jgi:hypothetical protein
MPTHDYVRIFHARYRVDPATGCWVWHPKRAARSASWDGRTYYPQVRVAPYITMRASHFSLQLDGRPLKPGEIACHHCDNRLCVNPEHLFAGSHRDNVQDCIAKGRFVQDIGKQTPFDWTGRKHSLETREKMRQRALERERKRRESGLKQQPGRRVKHAQDHPKSL